MSESSPTCPRPRPSRRSCSAAPALGAGAALSRLHQQHAGGARQAPAPAAAPPAASNAAPGKKVTIGFSAPAADHGWIAAITNNAKAQAGQYSDVDVRGGRGPTNDITQQIAAVETLIDQKVGVLVLLPHDGKQLTVGRAARRWRPASRWSTWTGSSTRRWPTARRSAATTTAWASAPGNYIGEQLKAKGVGQPDHRRDRRHRQPAADPGALAGLQRRAGRRTASRSGRGRPPTSPRRAASGSRPTCCRPRRRWTRCGTTTTTRASACWPRSSRPAATSSSWSAAPARPRDARRSRPTTPCSRRP